MNPAELERYLHERIPLSRAMGATVITANAEEVLLSAPLAPNVNHRETVFGGSASALCILAAWSLVHVRLLATGTRSRLVIQRNTMEYLLPIQGQFSARARLESDSDWERFERSLTRKGRGRIDLTAILECGADTAGRLTGTFVALKAT